MTTAPNVMDPGLIADPFGGYGRLREEAPVLRGVAMDGSPAWYVTRQDDVRDLLADHRFVTNPTTAGAADPRAALLGSMGIPREYLRYLTHTVLDVDGIDHSRVRRLVSRTFTVFRVTELRPHVEEIAAALLDALPERVDLLAAYAYPLPITVISELVGVPETDRPAWRRWAKALVTLDKETVPDAMRDMVAHCQDLISRRRAEPTGDLISGLVAEHDDGDRLTDTEIVTMILTLVLAGHETTAHLISNGTLALLRHPDQLDLLRRDPSLWPGAVHELMRFCGPAHITRLRYATEEVELGGITIHAGDAVQSVLVSANFDPRAYEHPEQLDVTRRLGPGDGHVGFGHGAHYCLGAALARQEAEVALRALVERFPDLALDGAEPEWVPMPGSHRLKALPVRLQ